MLWSDAPHAGFSTVEPWLPLSDDWREIHVELQSALSNSPLVLYRALLALRRQEEALWRGDYVPIAATDTLLVYERRAESKRLLVVLNLSGSSAELATPAGTIIATTDLVGTNWPVDDRLVISPNEGLIIRLH
jgi:alpha-glucosidase